MYRKLIKTKEKSRRDKQIKVNPVVGKFFNRLGNFYVYYIDQEFFCSKFITDKRKAREKERDRQKDRERDTSPRKKKKWKII